MRFSEQQVFSPAERRQTTTNGYADQEAVVRPGSPEVMSCLRLSRTIKSPTVTQRP